MCELKPKKNVQKILLSSPAHFTSTFETDHILLHPIIHDDLGKIKYIDRGPNPFNRFFFILVFKNPGDEHKNPALQNYYFMGDYICQILGFFFGKRFDNLGAYEMAGIYKVPNIDFAPIYECDRIFNNWEPRKDCGYDLTFDVLTRIDNLIFPGVSKEAMKYLLAASRQYWRSLQLFEIDPELAFLNLVSCGEILSNAPEFKLSEEELYSIDDRSMFLDIKENLEKGKKYERSIKSRFFQVKRKYAIVLEYLLSIGFKSRDYNKGSYNLNQRIKASYDLRSHYTHNGVPFGEHIVWRYDLLMGKPNSGIKELDKYLFKSPTYQGLERIMRFALLRFCNQFVLRFDERLDDPSPT